MALRYGTSSQGISQFYLHTPRTSTNGMSHTFAFPTEAGTYLPTPEGWKAELALGGWSLGQVQGHRSKQVEIPHSRNVKLQSAITPVLYSHEVCMY